MKRLCLSMLAALSTSAAADQPAINIQQQVYSALPQITVRSVYDFERAISLKLTTNPALNVSDVLVNTVSKLSLYDSTGVRIKSGFDIDPEHNLVVGFSGGITEIIQVGQSFYGPKIIASFKDQHGNFVSPPKNSLAVYDTAGNKLCFDYQDAAQAGESMHLALLLDRSWSMSNDIEAVKSTAKDFLNLLPFNASCAVANFGDTFQFSHDTYRNCGLTNFGIDDIALSGTTDIYAVLKPTFENFNGPYFQGKQKAVVIVTDGYTLNDATRRQELSSLKGDTLTLVYFIGGTHRNELEGITDHFVSHQGDIATSLGRYFSLLGSAYSTQKVLNIRSCQGGAYAQQ